MCYLYSAGIPVIVARLDPCLADGYTKTRSPAVQSFVGGNIEWVL